MTRHKQKLQHRYSELFDVGPVGSPRKSMKENFNPKGNREEEDTFEAANNSWENGRFTCGIIIRVK